jgi:DNA-directed RNA polymerase specialized sigma24 family protein
MIVYRKLAQDKTYLTQEDVVKALQGDNTAAGKLLNFFKRYLWKKSREVYLEYSTSQELWEYLVDNSIDRFYKYYTPKKGKITTWLFSIIPSIVSKFLTYEEYRKPVSYEEYAPGTEIELKEMIGYDPGYEKGTLFKKRIEDMYNSLDKRKKVVFDMLTSEKEDYTQRDIAAKLDVSPSLVNYWVRTIRENVEKIKKEL